VRAKLSIGFEGEVAVPPRQARSLGLAPGDAVDVAAAPGAFLLVTPARPGRDAQQYFAGSLASLNVVEVIQFIFTALKSGVLLLRFGGEAERAGGGPVEAGALRRRSLYFRDGQLVFASSTDACDRLGPVLWRQGLLSWADLERCGAAVKSGRPLGQVLVDEKLLTPAQVYAGVAQQVKEILLAAFLEDEGEFLFLEGPHDESNAVKLQERTRHLLLEGMKRVDEAERLLAEVGGRGAVLARAVEPPAGLGEFAARLMRACDGQRTIAEAAVESGLGLLEALRQASPLFSAGALVPGIFAPKAIAAATLAAAATPVPGSMPGLTPLPGALHASDGPPTTRSFNPFEIYRRCLKKVHGSLAELKPGSELRLNSYFDRLPEKQRPFFEGVRLDAQGDVDVARVLSNVKATGAYRGAAAKARSLEALEDFLAFALFEVKNLLTREQAEALLREVGRMQVGKA